MNDKPIWVKHIAEIAPKQGFVRIVKLTSTKTKPKFRQCQREIIKIIPIPNDIPKKEYEHKRDWFDSSGLQTDDRWGADTFTQLEYDRDELKKIINEALKDFNRKPILIS